VPDLPELSGIDDLLGECHRRHPAIVEQHHVLDVGPTRGRHHALRGLDVERERFFAEDVLARFRRGEGDLRMGDVGRADVHDVDVRRLDDLAPVGRGVLPT
jgi:hypothetical protein